MKLYSCSKCANLLYFENTICLQCGSALGFDPGSLSMLTLVPVESLLFSDFTNQHQQWKYCANAKYNACNWLVPAGSEDQFCVACSLNRTIPFLGNPENLSEWIRMEAAKHRLLYSLLTLHLPVEKKKGTETGGLIFEFLEDNDPFHKVVTGHDEGRIELNINEADEAQRVRNKIELGERYRTLLGHFRHEIGHYYWDVFYRYDDAAARSFRNIFGDERRDYDEALKSYYANGAGAGWNDRFITEYASAHPWEDWAETWAHYLHMMDALETAYSFGLTVNPPKANAAQAMQAVISRNPYEVENFDEIMAQWLPLTFASNYLNRSMGHADFYPFIIAGPVARKLEFIHGQVKKYVGGR